MVFMVFSFQHYLSFVERFVENMLSRKYLMFNTSFIIFNNSTKIRGVLSVIFMNRTHPPTSKNVMLMLQYLFTTVRQRQANKQEDIQLKAVVLLLSCRIMTLLFSFAPYNLLKMVARNRAARMSLYGSKGQQSSESHTTFAKCHWKFPVSVGLPTPSINHPCILTLSQHGVSWR